MALAAGTRLGPYEILSPLGSGGMGEVYRARDTKLNRDVALKILPDAFASDPDRLARFTREAQTLASLNHPNIAHIHGFEESNGVRALVMELVEGEDLSQRIARGAIPIDEALPIGKQIADALEAAHEQGIIHRDLKPANIKVRADGTVKVLDFGLARAMEPTGALSTSASMSPTITSPAMTQAGMILGTAAYMSPEQARGKTVDKRTDIWAFGAVLFEMLTAKRAFAGDETSDTLAFIITRDADWTALPANTPLHIRRLLHRCLEKHPKERLRDIGDARIEIQEAFAAPAAVEPLAASTGRARAPQRLSILWALASVLLAAITGLAVWTLRPEALRPVSRLALPLPPGDRVPTLNTQALALSPDGSRIAFVAVREGRQQIYLRAFDSTESKALAGTEGAESLFFSPDGKWLGFAANEKLMKVAMDGGAPLPICAALSPRGVNWGDNGTIVFAPQFGSSGLSQVSASGGRSQPPTSRTSATEEEAHRWPQLLPGGKAVLFTAWSRNLEDAQVVVQRLDTHERRTIIQGGTSARYVPTGHIVYAQAGTLMAVPFDLSRLKVTGDSISVAEGVSLGTEGVAQFDISNTGSLVYVPGGLQGAGSKLVWVDRKGVEQPLTAPPRAYYRPRLSPDGQQVAVTIQEANDDIRVYDLSRETLTRLTFGARSTSPVWTPDGKRIIFRLVRAGSFNLFSKFANGGGEEERLTVSQYNQVPQEVSPDGQALVFVENQSSAGLWILPLTGDRKARSFLIQTPFEETGGSFSPDGHWLAYASDESGRREVYVRPFPAGPGKWQISTEGGAAPRWARSGELFYKNGDKTMAVEITTQPGFAPGNPRMLFEGQYVQIGLGADYDVSPDGRRFLMLKLSEQAQVAPTQINVVLNWFEELKQKVPVGPKR